MPKKPTSLAFDFHIYRSNPGWGPGLVWHADLFLASRRFRLPAYRRGLNGQYGCHLMSPSDCVGLEERYRRPLNVFVIGRAMDDPFVLGRAKACSYDPHRCVNGLCPYLGDSKKNLRSFVDRHLALFRLLERACGPVEVRFFDNAWDQNPRRVA